MKKIISIILACMSLALVCGCKNSNGDSQTNETKQNVYGTHIDNSVKTNDYIIAGKESDYSILIAKDATEYEMLAAELIQTYLNKATKKRLEIVTDEQAPANGKYISLGATSLMKNSDISLSYDEFGRSGYVIKTVEDDVIISGSVEKFRKGAYYGALQFLNKVIDMVVYSSDEIYYKETVYIPLWNFDITEIPDFDSRSLAVHKLYTDPTKARLMRLDTCPPDAEVDIPGYGRHSSFTILPPDKYIYEHPEWYSVSSGGADSSIIEYYESVTSEEFSIKALLCVSNPTAQEESAQVIAKIAKNYPNYDYFYFGVQDNTGYCMCDICEGVKRQYNTNNAGVRVIAMNKVANRVNEIIHETDPNRDLILKMPAYHATVSPPTEYNKETGKYEAHCDEVIPNKYVKVEFIPLGMFSAESFDNEKNQMYNQALEGWAAIVPDMAAYIYGVNYNAYMINHASWDIIAENLRILRENKVSSVYNQYAPGVPTSTFEDMRVYVESNLMWNTNLVYDDLVDEFMEHYYGPAAPYVSNMYDEMVAYNAYIVEELKVDHGSSIINSAKYWKFSYVESIRKIMEQALATCEQIEDVELREKFYWRTADGYLENIYMQMQFHMEQYDKEHCLNVIELYEKVVDKFSYNLYCEGQWNQTYWNFAQGWRTVLN